MPQILSAIFVQIASIIGGGVNGALGTMVSLIKSGFQTAVQFHEEGIAFAREVGLNAREAQAYTEVLTKRTSELALKYGVAAEAIKEVQRNIVDATGKQYMLNDAEAERQVQINKLVGAGTAKVFTEQMMNHMGGQFSAVQGAVSKAYVTASKNGLNAVKFSEKVAQNLTLANKLSFRNGVDGIIKMTALSEKLGFNLQSIASATDKFMELDSAIASSAQLQMLGGAAGAYGSNPLTMAYEANYNPEAFTERMTNMLGGYAQFNTKTGVADVNGMNRDFVKNIASAMGISMDEAMSIAKKQAEVKYKEGAFGRELGRISPENRNAVLNRSYVDAKTGHLMINDVSGQQHDITKNGLDESILAELQKFDNMSEKDIMEQQALTLTSINDELKGVGASFAASLATYLNKQLPGLTKSIREFATQLLPKVKDLGESLGKSLEEILSIVKEYKDTFVSIAKGVLAVGKFLVDHWGLALAAWLGWKALGMKIGGLATTLGGKLGGKALGGLKNFKNFKKGSGFWDAMFGRAPKMHKGKNGLYYSKGRQGAWSKNYSKWAKYGTKLKIGSYGLGAATGIIQGVGAVSEYNRKKEEIENSNMSREEKDKALNEARIDKNSEVGGAVGAGVGSVLGTFFFGPLGGMIGGAVGEFAGKFIGKYWDPIVNTITSLFSKIGEGLKWFGGVALDAIKWLADNNPIGLMVKGVGKMFGKDWSITKGISAIFGGGEKHAEGGVIGGTSYSGDKIPGIIKVNSGEAVINPAQFEQLFAYVSKTSSILSKLGTSNGVSYYKASNSYSNLSSSFDNSKISSIVNNSTINGIYSTLKKSVVGGPLNTILSKIFNSNSNVVSTALNTNNSITSKPFGENSFRKIPKSDYTEYSYQKASEINVNDINLNINGTLKLDGGNSSKSLDINPLLNDTAFISSLKELIKQSINNDINNGRFMNDIASMRGMPSQVGLWGRK